MITTDADHNRIEMRAYGHLTLADLKTFEGISESRLLEAGKLDLLIDLRSLGTSTLDALVEELRFARKHATDFRRIAIVSDNELLNWGACIPGLFVEAEVCAFDNEPSARVWLDELGPLTDNAS